MSINPKKILIFLLIAAMLTGCASAGNSLAVSDITTDPVESSHPAEATTVSKDVFAMDTYMTITCYGERAQEAADAAEAEIKRLDELLSTGNPDSEISMINSSGSGDISQDTLRMIQKSLDISQKTDGAFDITIYPVMELWGFTSHDYKLPSFEELSAVLADVGCDKLLLDEDHLSLASGQGIDLGGIAKGYTSDRLCEIFAEYKLTSGLISLGGNVQLFGSKPDGSSWRVGIRDPHETSVQKVGGVLEARDCAVITSGAYERYFEGEDGVIYHHIIDPQTGYPAESGLISSTIVSSSGMLADALSTAVYVMGLDKAIEFWRSGLEDFEMILMTEDDEFYVTEGIADHFSSDYKVNIISR